MVQSPSLEANWFAASQKNSPHFTEPEGSLPHSQASAISPYHGPAQSSPYTHIPPPGDPSYEILTTLQNVICKESWWVARFSTPAQTGPGAYPVFCAMGTGSLFGGGKAPETWR